MDKCCEIRIRNRYMIKFFIRIYSEIKCCVICYETKCGIRHTFSVFDDKSKEQRRSMQILKVLLKTCECHHPLLLLAYTVWLFCWVWGYGQILG